MWALYVALVHVAGAEAVIHTDNPDVEQALKKGETHCTYADNNDADWTRQQLRMVEENEMQVKVKWVKAHTTGEQRVNMTKQQKYFTTGNDKADELAKSGAQDDGAEVAEMAASPPEEPDGCPGRSTETYRAQTKWAGPVVNSGRSVMCLGNVS